MPAVIALFDGGNQAFERQFADQLEQAQQAEQVRAGRHGVIREVVIPEQGVFHQFFHGHPAGALEVVRRPAFGG